MDTIWIILFPEMIGYHWDIEDIKSRLQVFEKFHRKGFKPLGFIKNMAVLGNDNFLLIEGSIAKYYNGNNIENFDFLSFKSAIDLLSYELNLPLEKGKVCRIDFGQNISLKCSVSEYFDYFIFLEHYHRINRYKTSLRFQNNSYPVNYLFYDKLKYSSGRIKLIKDIDHNYKTNAKNLMRIELQIQGRVSQIMKKKNIIVSDLFQPELCKELLKKWFDTYQAIHKKSTVSFVPKSLNGSIELDKFIRRDYIQMKGWDEFNQMLKRAVDQGSLKAPAKSKKLKQYRMAMLDYSSFEFQEPILELDHAVKVRYVEGLKQIYLLKKKLDEKAVK